MQRSRKIFASAAVGALAAATVAVFVPLHVAGAGGPATINVDTTDDENNDDGDCSLREAVASANGNVAVDDCEAGTGDDIVMIPAGTYTFAPDGDGDIEVASNMTLMGAGAPTTIIDANDEDQVFDVDAETVEFDGLTITGGNSGGSGGGIDADSTALTVRNSIVTGNSAGSDGGGIDSDDSGSSLTLINSTVSGNTAGDEGGGFRQDNSETTVVVTDSTISGNTARLGGGIHIDNQSNVTITGSTISDNTAIGGAEPDSFQGFRAPSGDISDVEPCEAGGGGFNQDEADGESTPGSNTFVNSTISGNTSECGGGIFLSSASQFTNVTITDNGAPTGGNVYSEASEDGVLTFANTIVAAPRSGGDCDSAGGAFTSSGGNIDTDDTCGFDDASDQTVTDAMLGTLADNGGSTETHLPLAGSPAIDLAVDANCPADDQRDVTRPQDGDGDGTATCDVGAVEVVFTPEPTTPDPTTPDTEPEGDVDADTATPATPTVARPTFTG